MSRWGMSGSGSTRSGRLAKGIASRRNGRRKKKKSDADLNFNRFWKVNGGKRGNGGGNSDSSGLGSTM